MTEKSRESVPHRAVTVNVPPVRNVVLKCRPDPVEGSPPPDHWTLPSAHPGPGATSNPNASPGNPASRFAVPSVMLLLPRGYREKAPGATAFGGRARAIALHKRGG